MKRFPLALVLLTLVGVCAMAGAPPTPSTPAGSSGFGRSPATPGRSFGSATPATPSAPPTAKAVGDIWTNSRGIKFTYIPAGEFLMGSPNKEAGHRDDELQHKVTLTKPFLLGVYTVTQGQWKAVMGSNPSSFTGDDNLPVEQVSWTDATNFCQRLSNDGQHYRLPSEAEWEYACRAGTATPFNTGDTLSTDDANFNGTYPYGDVKKGLFRQKTTPVGSFNPNAWGLYDMHGNVWQWCNDWLADYPSAAVTDPKGPSNGTPSSTPCRVMRGGAFGYLAENCRAAARHSNESKSAASSVGFRVAVDLR